MQNPSSKC